LAPVGTAPLRCTPSGLADTGPDQSAIQDRATHCPAELWPMTNAVADTLAVQAPSTTPALVT
jgi:hypothetical protein